MQSDQVRTRELLELADGIEATLVELVVAACECSEDEQEICDLVDEAVESGRVQLTATI